MKKNLAVLIIASFFFKCTYGQELKKCLDGDITIENTPTSCFSKDDGKITITNSNLGLLTFQLINFDEGKTIRNFTSDKEFPSLKAATYRIIAKDTLNTSCYLNIPIIAPSALNLIKDSILATKPNKDKSDGSLRINFSGGTPPYSLNLISIDNEILDTISNGNLTSTIFSGLKSGIYIISLKDTLNCQSVPVQYELSNINNFDFEVTQVPKDCDSPGKFKIDLSNGIKPYTILVKRDSDTIYSNTNFHEDAYKVRLSSFAKYELMVQDKRNIQQKIYYHYQDLNCDLMVSTNVIERPNIKNPNKGKISIAILDGKPPYKIISVDELTNDSNNHESVDQKNITIPNLKGSNYSIKIKDKEGRKFDTTIYIKSDFPSTEEINRIHEEDKNKLISEIDLHECNIKRIENGKEARRITLVLLGIGGSVATAGSSTLLVTIVPSIVSGGATWFNEKNSSNSLEIMKNNLAILQLCHKLYNGFSDTKFLPANWTIEMYSEYEQMTLKKIDLLGGIKQVDLSGCSESKLKKHKAKRNH